MDEFYRKRITVMQHALKFKGSSMTGAQRELLRQDIARSKKMAAAYASGDWSPRRSRRKSRGRRPGDIALYQAARELGIRL